MDLSNDRFRCKVSRLASRCEDIGLRFILNVNVDLVDGAP